MKMKKDSKPPVNTLPPKSPQESSVIMTELVLPSDTNALGTIFGGKIMAWIDIAAAISAQKYARRNVVTASIDALHFLAPVRLGQTVHIRAQVNYTSRTSMEVGVRVDSEDNLSGDRTHTATAYTTFVALDSSGKPTPVPPIQVFTDDEKRRYNEAHARRQARIRLAEDLKKINGN